MDSILTNWTKKASKFKEAHPNIASALYLIALSIFIVASMIKNSQMFPFFSQGFIFILELIPALMITIKILFLDEHNWQELVIFFLMEFYLYMSSYIAASVSVFYFSFFIIGAKDVKAEQILKVFMLTNIAFMIVAAILALSGVIWNYSTTRS